MNTPLADARIIGTLGRYAIEAAKHEVDLRDHSLHSLHFVRNPGEPTPRSMYLRALVLPDGYTYVVDLRHLAPGLREDMPQATERDRPGIVKFSLRGAFPTARALHANVRSTYRAAGHTDQQLARAA